MKVLVTGANGQLGRELKNQYNGDASKNNVELILTDVVAMPELNIVALDIRDTLAVYECIQKYKPQLVINCAAHTNVDKCESDVDNAFKINAIGPKNLAAATYAIGGEIVQVSTDYVFDGEIHEVLCVDGLQGITELCIANPQTIYGKSKLLGEKLVAELNPKHYIVRTAWLYGDGNNFVKTMLKLSETNKTLKVVNDQSGTPTSTVDLARVIIRLIEDKNYGLFHCTCKGECTWYEFTKEIFRLKGVDTVVVPCITNEFPRPAKRPKYSVLRNYMLELTCGDITRNWSEALAEYLNSGV